MRKSQEKPPIPPASSAVKGKNVPAPVPQEVKPFSVLDYAKDGISKQQVIQFKTAFDIFDHSGNGKVQIADIRQAFMNLGFHHQSIFAENILNYLEKKGEGVIDFGQFVRLATGKLNQQYTLPQTSIVFTAFDPKNTGKFSIYDLKDTVRSAGQDISEEELEKIFKAADSDGDNYVTAEDFFNIVTKAGQK